MSRSNVIRRSWALACVLALSTPGLRAAELQAVDGPCRVKLRTGRTMDASSLQPADDARSFWRLELPGGGAVVLPVRELRNVEALAHEPVAVELPGVAPPPDVELLADSGAAATCDPLASRRLLRWEGMASSAARKHGVDPALVRAIMAVESCGNPDAVSPKGALGLMQLMPKTAQDYGCSDPKDPEANLDAGCRHLARLSEKLDGNLDLVVAAYNAGEGAVAKAGGIPKYRETRNYVRDVKRHLARLSAPAPSM